MVYHPNQINRPYLRNLSSVFTAMKIKSASLFFYVQYMSFLRNLGQTDNGGKNEGDKKSSCKNWNFQEFVREPLNHQSNYSLAFQQHESRLFSAIKPCLGGFLTCEHTHPPVTLQLYWDFCYVKFTG